MPQPGEYNIGPNWRKVKRSRARAAELAALTLNLALATLSMPLDLFFIRNRGRDLPKDALGAWVTKSRVSLPMARGLVVLLGALFMAAGMACAQSAGGPPQVTGEPVDAPPPVRVMPDPTGPAPTLLNIAPGAPAAQVAEPTVTIPAEIPRDEPAPSPAPGLPSGGVTLSPAELDGLVMPALRAAVADLKANSKGDLAEVSILVADRATWSNAGLGCPEPEAF